MTAENLNTDTMTSKSTPLELGIAIEEIKAIADLAAGSCPEWLVPVFGAIERLANNAQSMAGNLEIEALNQKSAVLSASNKEGAQ